VGDFEVDTRVAGEAGIYSGKLSSDWAIWGPNGGYVASVALRAAGREAAIPRPVSFSCHFISVARFDVVELAVTPLHRGRRAESIHVRMTQEGRPILAAMLRTALPGPGLTHAFAVPPKVAPPEELLTFAELYPDQPRAPHAFWNNIDGKPIEPRDPSVPPRATAPTYRQWNRFTPRATFEDPFVDAARLLVLIDTMGWPAASRAHVEPKFQAPNLDVNVWFHRAEPEEPWLLSDHESPLAEAGLMATTGRVWSRRGRLLASGGGQLMCLPTTPA